MAKSETDVDFSRLPSHIGIIMDGNGRWAKKRFLTRSAGHRQGAAVLKKLCEQMDEYGFSNLTVYAFSTENWNRPQAEVNSLVDLLREYIQKYIDDAKTSALRISMIGDVSAFDEDLRNKIAYLTEITKNHEGLHLTIAINYGARDEIRRAVSGIVNDVVLKKLDSSKIGIDTVAKYLDTAGLPDPDLIIRTGGEMRLSNFLLWQCAYSELYFCEKFWPDFNIKDLLMAVKVFQNTERRFGG